MADTSTDRANAASNCVFTCALQRLRRQEQHPKLPATYPKTSLQRRTQTLGKAQSNDEPEETYLYLAYGSNLADKTFLGDRGIKPLSAINVQVPELRLTFDLPGLPYTEPCFANTGRREPENKETTTTAHDTKHEYRKDKWKKGLVGVVYEVTPKDYAHIIATEGGGSSYHDILVDCFPFISSDPSVPVPSIPQTTPFKAHTLFAPAAPSQPDSSPPPPHQPPKHGNGDSDDEDGGGRFQRPNTSYAQPSARYLALLTTGAQERNLPHEYQTYLSSLQPYTITSRKQQMGQFIFSAIWLPIIMFLFSLGRLFNDRENGKAPAWLRWLSAAVFRAVWASYDGVFRDLFGDGERTVEGDGEGDEEEGRAVAAGFFGDRDRDRGRAAGLLVDCEDSGVRGRDEEKTALLFR